MKPFLRKHGLALLSGLLLTFAFPRFHVYFFAWFALLPLFYAAAAATPRLAAAQFFFAGWLFHTILLQWLMTNIYWAGGWALLGQQGLCIALSVFWALVGWLWATLRARTPLLGGALAIALLWFAMEWIHARIFTGFGWSALGYSQGPDLPLAQWAALGGVSFVSFLLVFANALAALALREKHWRWWRIGSVLTLLGAVHLLGLLLLDDPQRRTEPFHVGVLQSNYPMEMKWDPEYTEEMVRSAAHKSQRLAQFETVDLMVWPEALVMRHYESHRLFPMLQELCKTGDISLFTGTVRRDPNTMHSYNSSLLMNRAGEVIDHYDKLHLVPFGEYVPFEEYLPFISRIVPGGGAGFGEAQKVLHVENVPFGPLICFEVLYTPMSQELRRMGADFLVVITNLAWFGMSNAIPQELEIARFRAIESRLPLVHSANTGISGVFDPYGRLQVTNAIVNADGRYMKWEDEPIPPAATIMRRRVGAFPLPAPAAQPIPGGPIYVPWVLLALTALLLIAAIVLGFRARGARPTVTPDPPPAPSEPKDPTPFQI